MPYNRALFLQRAALVADTPGVSDAYAAALGSPVGVIDALLGFVCVHVAGENGRLDVDQHGLFALSQTVLLEMSSVTGNIAFEIGELHDLCRVLQEYEEHSLFDFVTNTEVQSPEGLREATSWERLPPSGIDQPAH